MPLFLAAFLFLLPITASAAELETQVVQSEETSIVTVMLSPTSTSVNAVEGTLVLPGEVLKLVTGESVIGNWIEMPNISEGKVRFAGIIPGGFVGSAVPGQGLTGPAALFSIHIRGSSSVLTLSEGAVYLNDGAGTRLSLAPGPLPETELSAPMKIQEDRTPPEFIDVTTFTDPLLYDGNPALLISSFDAESGIDWYEVQEGDGAWMRTEATYRILDESGFKSISVRAYDRAGNFVETKIAGRNEVYLHLGYALIAAILFLAFLIYFKKRTRS